MKDKIAIASMSKREIENILKQTLKRRKYQRDYMIKYRLKLKGKNK